MHRYSDIFWPARSPDLTPCDFLWRYIKQKVYLQGPFTGIDHLEKIITEKFQDITASIIRNILREFCTRMDTYN